MYAEHVPQINAHMRESVDGFKRGVMFAVLSIRQHVVNVPDQLDAIQRGDFAPLWGMKRDAFDYLETNGPSLWRDVCAATDPARVVELLLDVPGLGIVKAAFVAQFLGHDIACLDSRNVSREGRNPRAFRTDGKPAHKLKGKIARYVRETTGHACRYWDEWCTDVANAYSAREMSAVDVSALHLAICCPAQFDLADTF